MKLNLSLALTLAGAVIFPQPLQAAVPGSEGGAGYYISATQVSQAITALRAEALGAGKTSLRRTLLHQGAFNAELEYRSQPDKAPEVDATAGSFVIVLQGSGAIDVGAATDSPPRTLARGDAYMIAEKAKVAVTSFNGELIRLIVRMPHPGKPVTTISGPPKNYVSAEELARDAEASSSKVDPVSKRTVLTPLLNVGPFNNHLEYRVFASKDYHAHPTEAELFYVLSGKAEMVVGGDLVDPQSSEGDLHSNAVTDGITLKVGPGDLILVPENGPHSVLNIDGQVVMLSTHLPRPAPGL